MKSHPSVCEGLETTLSSVELTHDAAAHVAAMRKVALRLDQTIDSDTISKLANTFSRQLAELKQYVAKPDVEDPFDALARSLGAK